MGLFSIFKRKADAKPGAVAAGPTPGGVQQARTRARQRLVGAVVLVAVGVIAFPLVFESQPRPLPVDIPISIPSKDGAPALVMPPARPLPPVVEAVSPPAKPAAEAVKLETGTAPAPVPVEPPPAPKASAPAAAAPEPVEAMKKASAPTSAVTPSPAAAAGVDAARAKALLEGKPASSKEVAKEVAKEGARFVVQVGAFAEAAAAQDTRARLEKLGLKTFTQVTETATGNRTRVRLGPFATREEAERVLAKTKAAGVSGVVLTL